ncbi:phosphatidate cytidylyltransferase [Candidatus Babeliales bacterium]|nr:phosphatidate cytidylyltransferase [Candidatus Babeliales bacterium]
MKQLIIRKAAVIGAGIMGSGIAAHLANAGIPTHLLLGYSYHSSTWLHMMQPWIFAWAADTAGYFAGNFFGKHKLCPNISPGKTVEGAVAILIVTSCMASSLLYGIMIGLAAMSGDLFISKLKRDAQVKDTGNCLPGHGGLLDRVDSVYGVICVLAFL